MPSLSSFSPCPKRRVFLNKSPPIINGLNFTISCMDKDMLSSGRIKSDNNKKMLPTETAPKIAVSSVLNIDPKNIPIRLNKVDKINNKSKTISIFSIIGALKTNQATSKINILCKESNNIFVK